ncbi:MAG TPA: hypothetical protein VFA77_14615, partial [Candidatus Eisenbacteria bacterium]|nr:hypothetical protein [Candidatus Eisenbacteria bacterium]
WPKENGGRRNWYAVVRSMSAPAGFQRTLAVARIYLRLRWFGDQPEKTLTEKNRWRNEHLWRLAKQ